MSGSKFVYVTYIRIPPEKLWHALTTPEIIKQYRFGMSVESEWKVGSTWRMYADGSLMDSPARLFVVQFVGNISENLIRDIQGKVERLRGQGKDAAYCIIDGQDTARVLHAYGKL